MVSTDDYWNTIPLFILFREAIEASIIVSVLISFVRRMNARQLEKQVWWGVGLAAIASIIFGVIFIVVYYKASENLFQGRNQMIFKASVSWIACAMITLLAFAMLRFMGWEAKWQRKLVALAAKREEFQALADTKAAEMLEAGKKLGTLDGAESGGSGSGNNAIVAAELAGSDSSGATSGYKCYDPRSWVSRARSAVMHRRSDASMVDGVAVATPPLAVEMEEKWTSKYSFFIAVFLTVIREGLESVVFLAGVGNAKPTAIILPGFVGLLCGISFGIVLYYTGKTVTHIKWLLIFMAMVLFFIAAGQAELGAGWLMRAEVFGTYYPGELVVVTGAAMAFGDGDEFYDAGGTDDGYGNLDLRPWWMRPLWDVTGCCNDTDETNKFLSLMRAIFGYNARPSFVEVMAYCGYWILAILAGCYKFHKRTLFDADHKHNSVLRAEAKVRADAKAAELATLPAEKDADA